MLSKLLFKNKHTILYGLSLALLLFLLKWLQLRLIIIDHALEIYIGAIALIFTLLGIWLAVRLLKPQVQTVIVEKEIYINTVHNNNDKDSFQSSENAIKQFAISKRELEVLQLIAQGLSNQEIAENLFVSLNTIKTHTSRLFEKLEVKRRTQAIEKAKKSGIIP